MLFKKSHFMFIIKSWTTFLQGIWDDTEEYHKQIVWKHQNF